MKEHSDSSTKQSGRKREVEKEVEKLEGQNFEN